MSKKILTSLGVVLILTFISCGGGSSKEAKELVQKILTIIGIPQEVITNICQTSNSSDMCEGLRLHKLENNKTKTWQKITETGVGQYLLETNNPCEPILLELKDSDVEYDNGEFFLKFSGVEYGKTTKELSILEAMVDASYLSYSSVIAIKTLHNTEAQNKFYATLYRDLKTNINTLRTAGLTKTQSIRGTLKEMAEELKDYGIDSTLPTKINACNDDMGCVEGELTELSNRLIIDVNETDTIIEAQKDNNAPLSVKEVSCEEEALDLNKGLVAYYKFEGNAKDSSGNGNDGTEYGGVSYSDGVIGQAGSFDGSDDYISIDNFNNDMKLIDTNFTISAWTYVKNKGNIDKPIFYLANHLNNNSCTNCIEDGYQFWYGWEENRLDLSKPNKNVITTPSSNYNNWKMVTVTFDKTTSNLTFMENGNIIDSILDNTAIQDFIANNPAFIGFTKNYSGTYFNGLIDDLRIYNRALDETEIAELYKMGNQ